MGNLSQLTAAAPDPESRHTQWIRIAARLRPGVTKEEAETELQVLGQRFAAQHPETDKGNGFHLEAAGSLPPRDKKSLELFLGALLIVVLLVLCIACANVANLLLAQGALRQREMAVRLALGATRAQLVRQLLLESMSLSFAGGLTGIALSVWATCALSSFKLPVPIPMDLSVGVDWRVVTYTFALSLAVGFLCGFIPAWSASRPSCQTLLRVSKPSLVPGASSVCAIS